MKKLESSSSEQTKRFGSDLAKSLAQGKWQRANGKSALVIGLKGDLGAGKTTFTQGFLKGLGIEKRSPSPTFIIFRRFTLSNLPFANFYHIDAYRIKKLDSLEVLGFKEIFADPKNGPRK
jgi:tRNA threonylcarbamoyladenosine biosynthesis protein TsaE